MFDIIINPFITILLFLYKILGGNVVLAIVVFTVLVRLATYPLTLKQQRSAQAMQKIQPEMKKLQEKYKNDKEKLAEAQMQLYREYGVNPLASCLPLLIQFPIMIGLYRAIIATLAATPLELLDLSNRLWVPDLSNIVPLQNHFMWLNLAVPDPLYLLPVLVVVTMWLQQKLIMPSTPAPQPGDKPDQTAAMTRQMTTIMPLMFGVFAITYASGLSVYFIASNVIGIVQYALMGKIDVKGMLGIKSAEPVPAVVEGQSIKAEDKVEKAEKAPASKAPAKRIERPAESIKPKRTLTPAKDPVIKPKKSGITDTRAARAKAKK
ncbi:MAG TPA: YidC/Oxa1 family membrane protein insertase [Aggregatilinea sp.]|uniref:YidC/Oxa1 family membrane protein insertase n=1 Tax=Aggregatilinea sp. TaxID=2806333 RepID=UPI002BCB557C|nr:YidC/Oxa1 family membrane protein insertase [Aggregatilinea sp.]HML22500.1 YidC/Oxa1 family membrane protein insertase [Aggregatilinea sp.]